MGAYGTEGPKHAPGDRLHRRDARFQHGLTYRSGMPPPDLPLDLHPSDVPLLVGVSGGRDSVTLLHRLVAEGMAVEAAHVNYGLRGADSDADEAFVRDLCARLGVPLHVHRVPPSGAPAANRQAWARAVRYTFFGETAAAGGLAAVAVAHHADDQAETVLLALQRSASLAAVAAMRPRRDLDRQRFPGIALVRPLLHVQRAEVHACAEARGWAWREDTSNRDRRYVRAAVRHDLLPALECLAPGTTERLVHVAAVATRLVDHRRQAAPTATDGRLPLGAWEGLGADERNAVLAEALRRFLPNVDLRRSRVEALRALTDAQPGRAVVWPDGTVWRERDALRFVAAPPASPSEATVVVQPRQTVAYGRWTFEAGDSLPMPADPGRDPHVAYVPLLAFPLAIRPWQPGERLSVLGASELPRISGLLTRAKVPSSERDGWPVVTSASGEPLWLPGVRIGRGCAIAVGEPCVRVVFSSEPQTSTAYF